MQTALPLGPIPPPPAAHRPWTRCLAGESAEDVYQEVKEEIDDDEPDEVLENADEARMLCNLQVRCYAVF